MPLNDTVLKIISNETKNLINKLDIVTPSIYTALFSQLATEHSQNISDEYKLTDNLLDQKIAILTNLQNKNVENANKLSIHTSSAISAIQGKDDKLLRQVLYETQNLRLEIEKLKENMYKDELTSAYNRKWLNDTYTNDDSDELKSNGILALIDLNYFKNINDTYGHIVGDKVLIYITQQLKKSKEPIVRYGGDEFILIFSDGTSKTEAIKVLTNIRETMLSKHLIIKESTFRTSFSFGAHAFKQGDMLSEIIELADKGMYDDKIQIKQRVTGI